VLRQIITPAFCVDWRRGFTNRLVCSDVVGAGEVDGRLQNRWAWPILPRSGALLRRD